VIVVAGAQQAFSILAQVLLDHGDSVWVEDPGYSASLRAVVAAGGVPFPMPVDELGADFRPAEARAPDARLAIVTPANQFPLGVAMSDERRRALVAWATRVGGWILEDDYDGEFRYAGKPLPSLASMSPDRVVYVGTFSKVLAPSLRLGYIVVPDALVDAVLAAKAIAANRTATLEQAVTSDFIASGQFLRHVRRMRVLYDERRESLERLVLTELDGAATLRPVLAGMQAILDVPSGGDALARRAAEVGIQFTPLAAFAVERLPASAVVLGFAAVAPKEQRRALRAIAEILAGSIGR
jgi:GntR family transcriptional regulator/MocR family aminotransferase